MTISKSQPETTITRHAPASPTQEGGALREAVKQAVLEIYGSTLHAFESGHKLNAEDIEEDVSVVVRAVAPHLAAIIARHAPRSDVETLREVHRIIAEMVRDEEQVTAQFKGPNAEPSESQMTLARLQGRLDALAATEGGRK